MKRVLVDELESGMVVARTVIGSDGRALLVQNTSLSEVYIKRLHLLGLQSVYIKDGLSDIDIPEVVSMQVRSAVSNQLNHSLQQFSSKRALDVKNLRNGVSMLLDDIVSNHNTLIHLDDIRSHDDYLLLHSLNVAILSMMTGLTLGYNEGNLIDLGLGALLHDIGMIMIDPHILNKAGGLTPDESEEVRKHPEIGFNILRTFREIPTRVTHIAYQHHEKVDGTGYPRQLDRKTILEYAQITAVADTFDAVVADRPFRKGYSTTDGMIILRKLVNTFFDPEIVEAFATNIAMYPVGSLISLNTGHIALVTSATKINSSRPRVNVVCDSNFNLIYPNFEIDLQKTNEVSIVKRLNNEETDMIRCQLSVQKNPVHDNPVEQHCASL
ncbi:MAG: HD-GYP domain-containing protein [Syntrophomonas sp.]|nr:HD-GYP domain-containing protein [Syntrophomonas sp.]